MSGLETIRPLMNVCAVVPCPGKPGLFALLPGAHFERGPEQGPITRDEAAYFLSTLRHIGFPIGLVSLS